MVDERDKARARLGLPPLATTSAAAPAFIVDEQARIQGARSATPTPDPSSLSKMAGETNTQFNNRVKAASFIGTLQASYTDFHYLRDIWKKTTEKDALLGVGITGIGSGEIEKYNLKEAAKIACDENERIAKLIGINKASRVTTIKPSGTTSLVLGTSSGIHAWHDKFYIRRIRVGKNEAIYSYLKNNHPELIEDDHYKPEIQAVISIPQKAPKTAILRSESPLDLLERVKRFNIEWVREGYRKGDNNNNVSATISIKPEEWKQVGEWMWENKEYYNGLSVLPYNNGTYIQAPFTTCSEEEYNDLIGTLHEIDLTKVIETEDETNLMGELACSSSGCEVV